MAGDGGEIDGRGKECAFITPSVLRAADGVLPAGPNGAESGAELVISADTWHSGLPVVHYNGHLDLQPSLPPPFRFRDETPRRQRISAE